MATDSWSRISSSSSRRHALQSQFDLFIGFDELDGGDDDSRAEFACPFCAEEFDVIGLCCHIDDEHPVEAKNGVCPVCAARVGMDMVEHITMQHGNFFKMQRRRRFRKGSSGSHNALSLLKKELREGHLQSILGGATYAAPSNAAPDPLLSSFIYNLPSSDSTKDLEPLPLDEEKSATKSLDQNLAERLCKEVIAFWSFVKELHSTEPSLSEKDQKERAQRSEFVQELLLSTIFKDTL